MPSGHFQLAPLSFRVSVGPYLFSLLQVTSGVLVPSSAGQQEQQLLAHAQAALATAAQLRAAPSLSTSQASSGNSDVGDLDQTLLSTLTELLQAARAASGGLPPGISQLLPADLVCSHTFTARPLMLLTRAVRQRQ